MKALCIGLALASLAVLACGCAALPSKSQIVEIVTAPAVDATAVKFETAVAVMVSAVEVAASDPASGVDRAKLANAVTKAANGLDEARVLFDARSGDPTTLISKAFDALDEAVPTTANIKVRFALAVGRSAASAFVGSLTLIGPPTPPSERLKSAREATDKAVDALLIALGAPPG